MTQLVTVLSSAGFLIGDLYSKAQDPIFEDKQRTAFRADALNIVSATQALTVSPSDGYESDRYEGPLDEIRQAREAVGAIDPAAGGTMHRAHLETVQAVEALRHVTAKPAVAIG